VRSIDFTMRGARDVIVTVIHRFDLLSPSHPRDGAR
jgi:hypothetical protein